MSIVTFGNELNLVFLMSLLAFLLAMLLTSVYTYFAYKYKFWKTQRTSAVTGERLKIFNLLHKKKIERHIPTMAGIVAVTAIVAVTLAFNLDRAQTWLPLAALMGGAAIGLIDDILNVFGSNRKDAGLRSWVKFAMIIGASVLLSSVPTICTFGTTIIWTNNQLSAAINASALSSAKRIERRLRFKL